MVMERDALSLNFSRERGSPTIGFAYCDRIAVILPDFVDVPHASVTLICREFGGVAYG